MALSEQEQAEIDRFTPMHHEMMIFFRSCKRLGFSDTDILSYLYGLSVRGLEANGIIPPSLEHSPDQTAAAETAIREEFFKSKC